MDVKEGHEDADLHGLPMEKVVLEISFDFEDFSIRWRDDGILGGGGCPVWIAEETDDEKGDSAKNSREIDPAQEPEEKGGHSRRYDEGIALFGDRRCHGTCTNQLCGSTQYPHLHSSSSDGDG